MSFNQKPFEQMTLEQMSFKQMSFNQKLFAQMSLKQMPFEQMSFEQNSFVQKSHCYENYLNVSVSSKSEKCQMNLKKFHWILWPPMTSLELEKPMCFVKF
jgi:hypothetical protein